MSNVGHGTCFGGPVSGATYFPQVKLTTTSINTSMWKDIGQVYTLLHFDQKSDGGHVGFSTLPCRMYDTLNFF